MIYYKYLWVLRAILYKPFFKKFGFLSYIGKPVIILGSQNISIGQKVRIYPLVRMETFNNANLIIQDNVGIAQNVQITCSDIDLTISSGTVILANSYITNIDHSYEDLSLPILDQKNNVKRTFIGENCFIGIGSSIQAGTILGKHCIVGSNSVVCGVFPDYCVIVGSPAKIIKKYNLTSNQWEKTY
jgi:acetyltransferase-like isoleucine patch superfamily enzyme